MKLDRTAKIYPETDLRRSVCALSESVQVPLGRSDLNKAICLLSFHLFDLRLSRCYLPGPLTAAKAYCCQSAEGRSQRAGGESSALSLKFVGSARQYDSCLK